MWSAAAWARPVRPRPIRRPAALGPRFSGHHGPRHGARAGDAARPSRHRLAVCGGRRLDGRHAGAAVGGKLSRARFRGAADRLRDAPFGAEHRLSRGRPPGRDGRSGLARRPLFRRGHQSAARARGRAHGRAHHLSVGRGAAPQIRPPLPGPRQSDLLVRRGFQVESYLRHQGSASSSASTPIPISISRARWIISILPPITTACWPKRSADADAVLRHFVHQGLAVSDSDSRAIVHALNAARRARLVRRDHDRQGPRRLPARRAGTIRHRARLPRGRGRARGLPAAQNDDADRGSSTISPWRRRRAVPAVRASICCSSPTWSSRARGCSTSAAATANCCGFWKPAASTGAASSCRARASTNASPRGWR